MGRKTFTKIDTNDFKVPDMSNLALADSIIQENTREHANIPLDRLHSNPRQPRKYFDAQSIQELAEDIRENNLIEEIVVRRSPTEDDTWEIVCGERRVRACRDVLHWSTIPAQIRSCTNAEMLRIAIAENDQHEQLSPYERALAYDELRREIGSGGREVTIRELAMALNKNKDMVQLHLNLLRAQPELQEWAMEDPSVPLRTIDELRRIEDETMRRELIQLIREKFFNQDEVITIAQQFRQKPALSEPAPDPAQPAGSPRTQNSRSLPGASSNGTEPTIPLLRVAVQQKLLAKDDKQFRSVFTKYQQALPLLDEEEKALVRAQVITWIETLQQLL